MTNEQIKELALKCGFKERPQANGLDDLNPYVYDFAHTLLAAQPEVMQKKYQQLLEKADRLTVFSNNIGKSVTLLEQEAAYWKTKCQALQAGVKQEYLQ